MSELFETPRWPGGPHLCEYENLPAFPTPADIKDFNEGSDAVHELARWQCPICQEWHFTCEMRAPAGATSGRGRHHQPTPLPRLLKELLPVLKPKEFESMGERWMFFQPTGKEYQDLLEQIYMKSFHGEEETMREKQGQWKFVKG